MSAIRVPEGVPIYFSLTTRHPTSGSVQNADTTPQFSVFKESSDTGVIYQQNMVARSGYVGVYRGNFVAETGASFESEKWYTIVASASVDSIVDVNAIMDFYLEKDLYYADIFIDVDSTGGLDEYTVSWFKNDQPIEELLASPTIQVIKRSNAANLVAQTTMTAVGSTGIYKHSISVTANRISTGESYIVVTKATINGATRTWRKIVGRDN